MKITMPTAALTPPHPLAPTLFADTPMDRHPNDPLGIAPFLQQGDRKGASRRLRLTVADPNAETRLRLWAAATLRAWNEPIVSDVVMGVVIEYPIESGVDYVAAYLDGSARYLNYSGKAIIWDSRAVPEIETAVFALLKAGTQLRPHTTTLGPWSPTATPRVTCLTLAGNLACTPDNLDARPALSACVAHAGELMGLLIQKSQQHPR